MYNLISCFALQLFFPYCVVVLRPTIVIIIRVVYLCISVQLSALDIVMKF